MFIVTEYAALKLVFTIRRKIYAVYISVLFKKPVACYIW